MITSALLVTALLLLPAGGTAQSEYQAGQAALGEGRTEEAEAHYRRALEHDPEHMPALLRLATMISWQKRFDESIELFQEAERIEPGNRDAMLGIARVSAWAGRSKLSIDTYNILLEKDSRDRDALLGSARAHSWAGRHPEALDLYERVLEIDPADKDARLGIAQVLSWMGMHDQSLERYAALLSQEPANHQALGGRARVLMWQGRMEEAWEATGKARAAAPEDQDLVELERIMRQRLAPTFRASGYVLQDTDDNRIDSQVFSWTYAPTLRSNLGFSFNRFDASLPQGPGSRLHSRLEGVSASGSIRLRPALVLSGSAGVEKIISDDRATVTHGSGSAALNYRLSDRWSLHGGLSHGVYQATARSLAADVSATTLRGTATFVPLSRVTTRFGVEHSEYTEVARDDPSVSDDNSRDLVFANATWRVPLKRPEVSLSLDARASSCDRPGTGYFCPDSFNSQIGRARVGYPIGTRYRVSAEGLLGVQRVKIHDAEDASSDTVSGYMFRASMDVGHGLWLEAYHGRWNIALSAQATGGADYKWTETGVRLRWRFDRLSRIAEERVDR